MRINESITIPIPLPAKHISSDTELKQHNSNRTQNGREVISDRDTASGASEYKDSSLDKIFRQPHPGVPTAAGAPTLGFSRGTWEFAMQLFLPLTGTNLFDKAKNPVSNFKGQAVLDKPMPQSPPLGNSITGLGNFERLRGPLCGLHSTSFIQRQAYAD